MQPYIKKEGIGCLTHALSLMPHDVASSEVTECPRVYGPWALGDF